MPIVTSPTSAATPVSSTWLTRIVVNRALMRIRSQKRDRVLVPFHRTPTPEGDVPDMTRVDERAESAHDAAIRAELRRMVERRLDELPVAFRTVFVMRDIEEMSVQENAECLSIPTATVRTRLFRARALIVKPSRATLVSPPTACSRLPAPDATNRVARAVSPDADPLSQSGGY